MATAEQLLQLGQQFTSQMLDRMDRSLSTSLQIRKDVSNAEVGLALKGLDYAETQRMNDARIMSMNNANAIQAKQFEIQTAFMPLELESRRLQLEASKVQLENQKQVADFNVFNSITKPYDIAMGSRFIEAQSPEYMRGYMDLKSKHMAIIGQGGVFDPTQFEKDVNDLNDQYKDFKPAPNTAYDPVVGHMLGMVDPNSQKIYEQRNPVYQKNANALAVSYVTGSEAGVANIVDRYGSLFSDEKLAQVSINRETYQTNAARMDSIISQIQKLNGALGMAKDEATAQMLQIQVQGLREDYTNLQTENKNIISNLTQGNYAALGATTQIPTPPDNRVDLNQYVNKPANQSGIRNEEGLSSAFQQRVGEINTIFRDPEYAEANPGNPLGNTELRNIDLSWFENNLNTGDQDDDSAIRTRERIREGIEATGNIKRLDESRAEKLISYIQEPIQIPIDRWLADTLLKNVPSNQQTKLWGQTQPTVEYQRSIGQSVNLMFGNGDMGISSYKDIESILRSIPGKQQREEAKKEIYAAMTAAAYRYSINKR